MSILSMMFLAVLGQAAAAEKWVQQNPELVEAFVEKCKKATPEYIESQTKKAKTTIAQHPAVLKRIQRTPINTAQGKTLIKNGVVTQYGSPEAKVLAVEKAKQEKSAAEQKIEDMAQLVGRVRFTALSSLEVDTLGTIDAFRVFQVVDKSHAIVRLDDLKGDVWIECDTRRMVDGKRYELKEPTIAIVVGTKQYETAGESVRTIPFVATIPTSQIEPSANKD